MEVKNKNALCIILIMITMLSIGKFGTVSWLDFLWYPLIFSSVYYLDEIIDFIRKVRKHMR